MFGPILPNDLLDIVNDYAEPTIDHTCKNIDTIIVQQLLNCWSDFWFDYFTALCDVCRTDDFELLVWLCNLKGPKNILTIMREKKKISDMSDFTYPLLLACCAGNKKIIMWLVQFFEYDRSDVRYNDDACLIELYDYGHNDIAKWFIKRFNIKNINGDVCIDTSFASRRKKTIASVKLAKLFIRWNKTDGSVWKMMRTDWRRVCDHVQNCGCENKAFVVCRCGTKICTFLQDYHIEYRGCCYACDK